MFAEAFLMTPALISKELMDMGVDDDLVRQTGGNVILLRALYIYVHVEAMNV